MSICGVQTFSGHVEIHFGAIFTKYYEYGLLSAIRVEYI